MGCPVCGGKLDDCGERPVYREGFMSTMVTDMVTRLFYCEECDANIEYTKLKP